MILLMERRNTEVRLLLYHEFIFGGRCKNILEKLTIDHYMLVIYFDFSFLNWLCCFSFRKFKGLFFVQLHYI
jgi:hypothetical protein